MVCCSRSVLHQPSLDFARWHWYRQSRLGLTDVDTLSRQSSSSDKRLKDSRLPKKTRIWNPRLCSTSSAINYLDPPTFNWNRGHLRLFRTLFYCPLSADLRTVLPWPWYMPFCLSHWKCSIIFLSENLFHSCDRLIFIWRSKIPIRFIPFELQNWILEIGDCFSIKFIFDLITSNVDNMIW